MREELAGDTELVSPVMNEFLEDGLDGLDSYGFRKSVKTLVFADAELEAIARMCGVEIEDKRCMIPAEKLMQLGQHLMEMMPENAGKEYGLSIKQERAIYASVLIYYKLTELTGVSVVIGRIWLADGLAAGADAAQTRAQRVRPVYAGKCVGLRTDAGQNGMDVRWKHAEKVCDFAKSSIRKPANCILRQTT